MKPYDILAIGELNVDLILNNIDGEALKWGKRNLPWGMILTLGARRYFCRKPPRWVQKVGIVGMIGQDTLGN